MPQWGMNLYSQNTSRSEKITKTIGTMVPWCCWHHTGPSSLSEIISGSAETDDSSRLGHGDGRAASGVRASVRVRVRTGTLTGRLPVVTSGEGSSDARRDGLPAVAAHVMCQWPGGGMHAIARLGTHGPPAGAGPGSPAQLEANSARARGEVAMLPAGSAVLGHACRQCSGRR